MKEEKVPNKNIINIKSKTKKEKRRRAIYLRYTEADDGVLALINPL